MRLVLRHKIHNFWKEKRVRIMAGFSPSPYFDPVFGLKMPYGIAYELRNGIYFLQFDYGMFISFEIKGKKILTIKKNEFSNHSTRYFTGIQKRKIGLMAFLREKEQK